MAEGKNKVIWYTNWGKTFLKLSDEEAGKLIKQFSGYVLDENPEAPDRLTELLFDPIKDTLKRDLKTYESKRNKNRENGKKGGRPKKTEDNPKKPNGYSDNPQKGVKDNDKVKGNDNVTEKENDNNKVYTLDVHNCLKSCLEYFPEHLHPKNEKFKNNWLDTIDKLNRIDKIPFEKITSITAKARTDEFWKGVFLSLPKLRKNNKEGIKFIVVFNELTTNQNGNHQTVNGQYTPEQQASNRRILQAVVNSRKKH